MNSVGLGAIAGMIGSGDAMNDIASISMLKKAEGDQEQMVSTLLEGAVKSPTQNAPSYVGQNIDLSA